LARTGNERTPCALSHGQDIGPDAGDTSHTFSQPVLGNPDVFPPLAGPRISSFPPGRPSEHQKTPQHITRSLARLPVQNASCIPSNPDIAGIGVRLSIYIQTLLSFVPALLFASDGIVDSEEEEVLCAIYTSLLLTACALVLSTIIQAATLGISVYHTLIVLNLSWMVNASALIICIFPTIHWSSRTSFRKWMKRLWPSRLKQLPAIFLLALHSCAMASLGVRVWAKVDSFGTSTQCTPEIVMIIFFHDFSITSRTLQITSLVIYSIALIPGVHAITLTGLAEGGAYGIMRAFYWLRSVMNQSAPLNYKPLYIGAAAVQFLITVVFIADTELMIRRNRHLVSGGESDWTFGQTLALILILLPLFEVSKALKPTVQETKWGRWLFFQGEWHLRGLLRRSGKEWRVYQRLADTEQQRALEEIDAAIRAIGPPNKLDPILTTLLAAKTSLSVASEALVATDALVGPNAHGPLRISRGLANRIRTTHAQGIKAIITAREQIVKAKNLRFPVFERDPIQFSAAAAALGTAKAALDTAKAALDATNIAVDGTKKPIFVDNP
jgi:hypothetical protein